MSDKDYVKEQEPMTLAQQKSKSIVYLINMCVGAGFIALACLLHFVYHHEMTAMFAVLGVAFMAIAGVSLYLNRDRLYDFYSTHLLLLRFSLAIGGFGAFIFGGSMLAFGAFAFADMLWSFTNAPGGGHFFGMIVGLMGVPVILFAISMSINSVRSKTSLLNWVRHFSEINEQ